MKWKRDKEFNDFESIILLSHPPTIRPKSNLAHDALIK